MIEAEAVHPVNDWREMGRRLEADRRCYAFFHRAWPQEPLIFTEVALTRGIASRIQPILDPDAAVVNPRTCDTAMFYSISNCQPGCVDSRSATPCSAVQSSNCGRRCPGCGGSPRFRRFPDFDRGSPRRQERSTRPRTISSPCALTICSA